MEPVIRLWTYESPLGPMTMAERNGALFGLWFDGQVHDQAALRGRQTRFEQTPLHQKTAAWLDKYFSGVAPQTKVPVDPAGTPFQKEVWSLLEEVPCGCITSYKELAKQLAKKRGTDKVSPRAVGSAIARNPVMILCPCHRVEYADGSPSGYAGARERKLWLQDHEKQMEIRKNDQQCP